MYRAMRKRAGILMRTQTLGPGVWPPLLWMDSTTAVAKWAGVTVPAAIGHTNAKEKRFLSWAEKVSYVSYMNLDMKWIPRSAKWFCRLAKQDGREDRGSGEAEGRHPNDVSTGEVSGHGADRR